MNKEQPTPTQRVEQDAYEITLEHGCDRGQRKVVVSKGLALQLAAELEAALKQCNGTSECLGGCTKCTEHQLRSQLAAKTRECEEYRQHLQDAVKSVLDARDLLSPDTNLSLEDAAKQLRAELRHAETIKEIKSKIGCDAILEVEKLRKDKEHGMPVECNSCGGHSISTNQNKTFWVDGEV